MQYRYLGRSGLQVSALSYGSWITFHNQVDVDAAAKSMQAAYDAGINFFDNAEAYAGGKAEEVMGAAIKKLGWRRGSYLVSTKLYWGLHKNINEQNTLNRKRLIEGMNGSLERFGLDYVDLVFCHRADPNTPIEETVWAMHNLIEWGKAMYWGTSEWSAAEIASAIEIAEKHHLHKPIMEQPQYNMFFRERFEKEFARIFKDYGIGSTTWSPLASGMLTGKYNNGIPVGSRAALPGYEWLHEHVTNPVTIAKVKKLQVVADDLGVPLNRMALAWILKNPNVSTVITGASRVEQLEDNLKSLDVISQLTDDVLNRIEDILENKPQ
ncbi:MAG: aldo/keto reductase [Anaerolineaceae bacterium]|nr:aldo/keto reductase [Anaerolineaceae bacterium]